MKALVAAMIVFTATGAAAQTILIPAMQGSPQVVVRMDSSPTMEVVTILPQPTQPQQPVVVYEQTTRENRSQRAWRIENHNGQWVSVPLVVGDED